MEYIVVLFVMAIAWMTFHLKQKRIEKEAQELFDSWRGWVDFVIHEGTPIFSGHVVGKSDNLELLAIGCIHKANAPKPFLEVLEKSHGELPDLIPAKCLSNASEDTTICGIDDPKLLSELKHAILAPDVSFELIVVDAGGIMHIDNRESTEEFEKIWSKHYAPSSNTISIT